MDIEGVERGRGFFAVDDEVSSLETVKHPADLAGRGAPARVTAAGSPPLASSAPTSSAASGTSTSPSSRAAVVPSGVRIVASRMGRL